MQRTRTSLLGLVILVVSGMLAPSSAVAAIKCWTNHEGQRECGNAVPPEFAQKGHEELSNQGIVIKSHVRAMTQEELRQEREEQERLAKLQAQRERDEAIQMQSDRVLLETYTTEEDLLLARSGQLQALDSRIKHTEQIVLKLERSLAELRANIAAQERRGELASAEQLAEIESLEQQIESNGGLIEQRSRERTKIIAKFDQDLARYRALRGNPSQ